jgi:tetratricopeptide (TPR) repeat protein
MNTTEFRFMGVVLAAAVWLAAACPAEQPASRPTEQILVALKDGTRLQGVPLKADDTEIVLQIGAAQRTIPSLQVTPVSLYMARRALADLTKAATHMDLGNLLLRGGQNALARREYEEAVRIDPSLAATVQPTLDALDKAPTGALAPPVAVPTATSSSGPASAPAPLYVPATPRQAEALFLKAREWAAEAKKIAPSLHEVESPHFLIFSAKPATDDQPVSALCERMYTALCRQFAIPPTDNIYAGKCFLYMFQDKDQYRKFVSDVVKSGKGNLGDAAGFCHSNGLEVSIVLGPAKNSYWFNELMVHESTHGFIARYQGPHFIPTWLNEGFADYMAATLVPASHAAEKYVQAQRQALREKKDVTGVFTEVGLNEFDYGIAQSFVRYLIARDRLAFIKLVTLLKQDKSEADALKESYGLTREDFLRDWRKSIAAQ